MAADAAMRSSIERQVGLRYSAGIHISLILIAITGLPDFLSRHETMPTAITVEVLPISEIANIRPAAQPDTKKEDASPLSPAPPTPAEKDKVKPVPPTKKEDAPPPPKESEAKAKEPLPKEKTDQKSKQEQEFEGVLKSLEDPAASKSGDKPADKKADAKTDSKSKSTSFDETLPLSMTVQSAIAGQVQKNWSPPIGGKDAHALKVMLRIQVAKDGTITSVEVEDSGRYNSDPLFRAAADAAVRAVHLASPLQHLPPELYNSWKDMKFNFDPKQALY